MRIPRKEALLAAAHQKLPDLLAPNLKVLFCGINPGLFSAYAGHHFARPGNRFWPTLYRAGLVDRPLGPAEEGELLKYGYGLTNVVARASARASELSQTEIMEGARVLTAKVTRWEPQVLALLGVSVYRVAFGRPEAEVGLQPDLIGSTRLWVLPSPSGLNAHYSSQRLCQAFRELRESLQTTRAT